MTDRRWLLINVFFWPDAVGGATRVMMDQARELVESGEDVTVLCSARISRGDYSVDVAPWEGCRVVRLHAPLKPWDHHTDEGCFAFMTQWLERERFDRVHAHCLQILTADVVIPALERDLSVTVSLHDGWWLGRHMFFTGRTGRSLRPGDWLDDIDLPESQLRLLQPGSAQMQELEASLETLWIIRTAGIDRYKTKMRSLRVISEEEKSSLDDSASPEKQVRTRMALAEKRRRIELRDQEQKRRELEETRIANHRLEEIVANESLRRILYDSYCRYRDLGTVLARVEQRYAVSESFANLYRQAGIEDVEVKENISLPITRLARIRDEDEMGTVFGFIGGWSLHKGVGVLEEACRLYEGPTCTLLVVHEAATLNDQLAYCWGKVFVKLIAPVPLDDIEMLFARFDVLIAASIWPESYGLVTREALNTGKRVIASRIGALADPLVNAPGGGFAFTAGSAAELAIAMRALAV